MAKGLLALMTLLVGLFGGGCSSEPDTTCTLCGQSFNDEACMRFAVAQGCTRGRTYRVNSCSMPSTGCQFEGCPVGVPIMCSASSDAGADGGM